MTAKRTVKAWAILNPDGVITTTRCAYNHWYGNDAMCVFHHKKNAQKYYCKGIDKLVRVEIREVSNARKAK